MLARLQRIALLNTLLLVLLWAWFWRDASGWIPWAMAGVLVVLLLATLAVEFVLLVTLGRSSHVPAPGLARLIRAWLSEALHATRVFAWRQPFATNAVADTVGRAGRDLRAPMQPGTPGVLFVHGYLCNRAFWNPWMRALRQRCVPFVAVNLEPVFCSIDRHAQTIEAAVQSLERSTGRAPVLVCHSMGGLVARAWLRAMPDAADRCAALVTIATPHAGTWLARWSNAPNGRQMRLHSDWLRELAQDLDRPALRGLLARTVCWYSDCDNIVFPVHTAALEHADNRFVPGRAHIALAFDPRVMRETLAVIESAVLRPA